MATLRNTVARLLVVDDDLKLVPLLERGLRYEGFTVDSTHSGAGALAYLREHAPDLVLLDIGMPDQDGFGVLRNLRRHSDVPVVMLTARDALTDKVGAFELGADDYLAKPFEFDELLARIRALLRRRSSESLDRIRYEDLECDLTNREVLRGGRRIALTATEFQLLAHLVHNARRVQSRQAMLRAVWGHDLTLDTNVVDVHVGHLRRKLGPPALIETVRGIGYRLRRQS